MFFSQIFRRHELKNQKQHSPKRRTLRLETLEDRQLLAVTAGLASFADALPMPTGAELVVTTNADDGDGSLRQAIATAVSGDTITFDASLAGETITLTTATLTIGNNITIDATGQDITIDGGGAFRVLQVNSGANVTVKGLTISGGSDSSGAGIYNYGTLTLDGATVSNNQATSAGAGIYNSGTMDLINSTVLNNQTSSNNSKGGGIYNSGTLNLNESLVKGNLLIATGDSFGAGIYNSGTLSVCGSEISENKTIDLASNKDLDYITPDNFSKNKGHLKGYGAGICNDGSLTLVSSSILRNCAYNGGGIDNRKTTTSFTMTDCIVSSNVAYDEGGGIRLYRWSKSNITGIISGGEISNNISKQGGGIALAASTVFATLEINNNCVITNNKTYGYTKSGDSCGAGIYNNSGTLTIDTATISDNQSFNGGGGGIYNYGGTLILKNKVDIKDNKVDKTAGTASPRGLGAGVFSGNLQGTNPRNAKITIYGDQVIIANNTASDVNSESKGGGIYLGSGSLTLLPMVEGGATKVTISGNEANQGGGIYLNSAVTLTNYVFSDNTATQGGGIYAVNGATLTDCKFGHFSSDEDEVIVGNTANSDGGGVYNFGGTLTLNSCEFYKNKANSGGGVYNHKDTVNIGNSCKFYDNEASIGAGACNGSTSYTYPATMNITGSEFKNNKATNKGGGVYNANYSKTLTLTNCQITDNTATKAGGGVYNIGTLTVNVADNGTSTFSGNSASGGGAIFNNSSSCNITGIAFSNNTAGTNGGGAIYNTHTSNVVSSVTITDCDFTGNSTTGNGGAIDNWGDISITGGSFTSNKATAQNGGAIHNGDKSKAKVKTDISLSLSDVDFNSNEASYGGAVMSSGILTIEGCNFGAAGQGNTASVAGGAISIGINGTTTFNGTANTFTENEATAGGGVIAAGTISFGDGVILTFSDNTVSDSDKGANIVYNRANTYPDWGTYITDADELEKVKPFTYVAASPSSLATLSTKEIFSDLAIASEDTALYLDVDGSGNFVEIGENFSAAELGLTSGESEVNFLYETGSGAIGGVLKLNVGDATPEISSIASAGLNRHQIAWSAIDGAKGYELAFSSDQENWSSVMTSETAYTLSGLAYGEKVYYKVRGTSGDLSSEWSASSSLVVCPMDINGDGIISPADLATFSLAMNSRRGDSRWDARCDVDGDGIVSASDLTYISVNWLSRSTSEKLTFPAAAAEVADVTTLDLDLSFVDDAEDSLFEEIF